MDSVTVEGITYQLSNKHIKVGDTVYNPFSDVIMTVDSEDDIHYVNDNYYSLVGYYLTIPQKMARRQHVQLWLLSV